MRLRLAASSAAIVTLAMPALAFAQNLTDTLVLISYFLNAIIGLFVTLAIVVFFWGLIKYLWSMDSENAHEGLKIMFWGLIAIFVMVSIWGIIKLLQNTLRVQDTNPIIPRGIQVSPSVR